MDARQQIIANQRVMGRQAAIMRLGQHIPELAAQVRIEFFPRNIDDGRDKPFEPIPAQQDTDPGTFLKRQDFPRIDQKILNGYLKQLIPGVAFQDMGEGFFVVTVFGKPRHFQRLADLAPEIGDITGNTVIGGRGEQAGKAAFADHLSLLIEFLHTDIIQMHRPVHRRTHICLGDDNQFTPPQKILHFRGHFHTAAHNPAGRVTQNTKA